MAKSATKHTASCLYQWAASPAGPVSPTGTRYFIGQRGTLGNHGNRSVQTAQLIGVCGEAIYLFLVEATRYVVLGTLS